MLMVLSFCATTWAASIDAAMKHFAKNDFPGAVSELNTYVAEHPTDVQGIFLLGYALYKAGRMEEAMAQFRNAYLLDPDFVPSVPSPGSVSAP